MGIDSGDAIGEPDPPEDAPRFIWFADRRFQLVCPRYAMGWGDVRPDDWPWIDKCRKLVNELNRMADKDEAQRIGRAHRWFDNSIGD